MATTKISALTELTNPALADVLVINDVSASSTKKIQLSNLIPDDAVGIDELSATGTPGTDFLRGDNTWATPTDTNTTYSAGDFKLDDLGTPDDNTDLDFSTSAHGLVPKGTNTGNFLKDNGTWAEAGGGKILQVVSAGTATYAGSSTATYTDTGLTVTITPASTSNKILILGTQADCYKTSGNTNNSIHMRLMRDATEILDICDRALFTGSAIEKMENISFNYLDSPSLDVAITYKTQFHNQGAYAGVAAQQQNAGRSIITVMEIEA